MFLRVKKWTFPACYSFSMFFVAVLLMGAASLFGLAADAITHKENKIVQEIKFHPVYCFNKPTEKLIIRPDFIGCVIGEDEPLGESEIVEGAERPTDINPQVLARFHSAQAAAKEIGIEMSEKIGSFYKIEPSDDIKTNDLNILYDSLNCIQLFVNQPILSK
jgi:hypothetical protein